MSESPRSPIRLVAGLCALLVGTAGLTWFLQGVLATPESASAWFSRTAWADLTAWLSGQRTLLVQSTTAEVPFGSLFGICAIGVAVAWLAGTAAAWLWSRQSPIAIAGRFGAVGGVLFLALGVLELVRPFLPTTAGQWFAATSHLWFSASAAGFLATPIWLANTGATAVRQGQSKLNTSRGAWTVLLGGCSAYAITFTWMNWGLYDALLLPHGDSAMYEEHIWNLTHGKGFRSYLDQGLFLGEHIQVVHLLLMPLHMIWPSQLMMELAESVALAFSAIPIFLIAKRHTERPMVAAFLGIAWLLYFPMHYLDISVDFKTFRPICFGVPALLCGIDQWERKRYRTAAILFVITLAAKEDFALVVAPLGLYFALTAHDRRERLSGIAWCIGVTVYLVAAVLFIIPAFRSGDIVHYSRYFGELGSSPTDIVKTAFTDPVLVAGKLFSARSWLYTALLLLPCGLLPLLSVRRALAVLPVFAMLCLLELSPDSDLQQVLVPFHHFHATMLPILWWAAAAGLGRFRANPHRMPIAVGLACCAGLTTGLFYSMSPIGISFHDHGSRQHGVSLYGPSERAEAVEKVLAAIPTTARVASTDYVHTRMTHYARSYDYSGYRTEVPEDADYIVIDAKHPWPGYSMATRVEDVKEIKDEPQRWEDTGIETDGYFIVLRRRAGVK